MEAVAREDQQDVTRPERDLPELAGQALVGAVDRDDGAPVPRAEPHLLQGGVRERRAVRDHRFEEPATASPDRAREVHLLGGPEARQALEVDHAADVPGERQAVPSLERLVGSDGRDRSFGAVELHEV